MSSKKLVIFGASNFAEVAHYYFTHDSPYSVAAFTVDASYLKESSFRGLPVVPFAWKAPESVLDAVIFASLGVFAGVGHYFVVKAFEAAAASVVSPFNYLQLLGATTFGYLLFGHLPDLWTWTGAAMIVGSGLYIIYRETRVRGA